MSTGSTLLDLAISGGRFPEGGVPGGILFVTCSFGVPQDTHLKSNRKYSGPERRLMVEAGFEPCTPNVNPPTPFLAQWGFLRRPA